MGFYNSDENAIEFLTTGATATVTFSKRKYINRIRKLAESHPDEVKIIADGQKNSGYLYAQIPVDWIKISPRVKRELSEEEKERMRSAFLANIDKTSRENDEFDEIDEDEYISSSEEE